MLMENKLLGGRHVVITGATGGIGKVLVEHFVEEGAQVTAVGRNVEALEALKNQWGDRVLAVEASFAQDEAFQCFLDRLTQEAVPLYGPIGILVNNAGIVRDQLAVRVKDEDWDQTLHMNLTVPFRLSRFVLSGMMRQKFGRIVNMASIIGFTGNRGQSAYSAAKGGLIALTKTLAQEGARFNVTANVVAPGYIETAMTDALPQEAQEQMLGRIPLGRFGRPEDVADGVVFLASPRANYITGQTLHINGGMAMF
jgi:3-oxoacyl-[acyl-carrier protein] reductase